MKRNKSSITAEGIAMARAFESQYPADEGICYDPYARFFVSAPFMLMGKLFFGYARRRSPGVFEFLATRCRYIDDYAQACLAGGIAQLVILGAGFDTRAYRFEQIKTQGVKVFEVDHPATQAIKLKKLKSIMGSIPEHVTFVPIDFAEESLDRLCASGYNEQLKSLFIWEGVTQYLSPEAVDATLAFVARCSGAGSSIIFDYVDASALHGQMKHKELVSMKRYQRVTGEGVVFGIAPDRITEFLESRGFTDVVNADRDYMRQMYFTGTRSARPLASDYAIVHATVKRAERR